MEKILPKKSRSNPNSINKVHLQATNNGVQKTPPFSLFSVHLCQPLNALMIK